MLTERDRWILKFIETHKSITINQCSKIFFRGNKYGYDQARKRLRKLNKDGFIKRYRQDPKSETVYYVDKKLKVHDLKLLDVIAELFQLGIKGMKKEFKIMINNKMTYIMDAAMLLNYKNKKVRVFVEIDYTHYTSDKKIKDVIKFAERKRKTEYIFLIVKLSVEKIEIKKVGMMSTLIFVPWNFNCDDMLVRSLRSLLNY